jgi:hypothetical protein
MEHTVMIRNFDLFCKLKMIKNPYEILLEAIDGVKPGRLTCSKYNAKHTLEHHDQYYRDYIYIQNGKVIVCSVAIPRLICSSCGSTHAYLPSCIIPHSSYSLFFVLAVLSLYYLKRLTVERLCEKFLISISTLYHWIGLYRLHKRLWFDIINHAVTSDIAFVLKLKNEDNFLELFFLKTGRSFMQTKGHTMRSRRN